MESKKYHKVHRRLYDAVSRFFSSKNIAIMICRSGRHRSVANAELWSNTLARHSRRQHMHLSGQDFWKNTCARKCSEHSMQTTRIFQTHHDLVRAECSRPASVPESVTEHWKRPRTENYSKSFAGNKSPTTHAERFHGSAVNSLDGEDHFLQAPKKRATSVMTMLAEWNLNRGILDELAGTFMKAPVHWQIVFRLGMSLAKQTRVHLPQIAGRSE